MWGIKLIGWSRQSIRKSNQREQRI